MSEASSPLQLEVRRELHIGDEDATLSARDALALVDEDSPTLRRVVYQIGDTIRAHEVRRIEASLTALPFVADATFDARYESLQVGLLGEGPTEEAIEAFMQDKGIRIIRPLGDEEDHRASSPETGRAILASILVILGCAAGAVHAFATSLSWQMRDVALNLEAILAGALLVWIGAAPISEALAGLLKRRMAASGMGVLVGAGIIIASTVTFFEGGTPHFEAGMIALGGALGLEWLGARYEDRARQSLLAWGAGLEGEARVLQPGGLFRVQGPALAPGDIIVAGQGDVLPVDGIISAGSAFIQEGGAVSHPAHKQSAIGEEVWAGERIATGAIAVQVSNRSQDSALAEAAVHLAHLGKEDRWLDDTLNRGVMLSAAAALIVAGGVLWLGEGITSLIGDVSPDVAALSILLLAAPVAVSRAVSLSYIGSAALLARRGAIPRDIGSIDRLGQLECLYFYRTGTLTCGKPEVDGWIRAEAASKDDILTLVLALAETGGTSVSEVLGQYAREQIVDVNRAPDCGDISFVPARGVVATGDDGTVFRLGNRELLHEADIPLERGECLVPGEGDVGQPGIDSESSVNTVIYLARGDEVLARFHLFDPVRGDISETAGHLRREGVELGLLTGDSVHAAAAVSGATGIPVAGFGLVDGAMDRLLAEKSSRCRLGVVFADRCVVKDSQGVCKLRYGAGMQLGGLEADLTLTGEATLMISRSLTIARDARRRTRSIIRTTIATCALSWSAAALGLVPLTVAAALGLGISAILSRISLPSLEMDS